MFDIRNCCNINKLIQICEDLQNAKVGNCLGVRKSRCGYYPAFTSSSKDLSTISEVIFNQGPSIKNQKFKITDFKGQVIQFFTTNARNSPEHKNVCLETLAYLSAFFINSAEIVKEVKYAIQELKSEKKKFYLAFSDLKAEMRKNQKTHDFTFYCQDGEVKAHWCVLSETPFFKFRTGLWEEKLEREKSCDLKQFPLVIVELLLDLIYAIPLKKKTQFDHLLWLYYLSDYLLLEEINELMKIKLKILFKKDSNLFSEALIYSYKTFDSNFIILEYLYEYDTKWFKSIPIKKKNKLVKILTRLAKQKHPLAQNHLGWCYKYGDGVEKDLGKAVELYQMAAELGYAPAQKNLAFCYRNGDGVPKDLEMAVKLFTMAAVQGSASAQYNLAFCYENGEGVQKDLEKAIKLFIQATEQGDPSALCNLAFCFRNGDGVQKNLEMAASLYAQAAEQSDASALNNLAFCYETGEGVQKDLERAVVLYTLAAEQGHASAQYNLALCYRNGDGVQKNLKKAVSLYTQAAEQNHASAQYNLASCYENGSGVQKDLEKALSWYTKAANQGDEDAIERIAIINRQQQSLRA